MAPEDQSVAESLTVAPTPSPIPTTPPLALRFQSVSFKEPYDTAQREWREDFSLKAARLPDGSHILWMSESHGPGGIAFIPSTTGWK